MALAEVDVIDQLEFTVRKDDIRHFTEFFLEIDFLNGFLTVIDWNMVVRVWQCGHG
jgi:hypothetical protein